MLGSGLCLRQLVIDSRQCSCRHLLKDPCHSLLQSLARWEGRNFADSHRWFPPRCLQISSKVIMVNCPSTVCRYCLASMQWYHSDKRWHFWSVRFKMRMNLLLLFDHSGHVLRRWLSVHRTTSSQSPEVLSLFSEDHSDGIPPLWLRHAVLLTPIWGLKSQRPVRICLHITQGKWE